MDRWQNRVAVVTGASAGIGAAITKELLKQGLVVAGLARRKERIDELRQKLPADQQKRLHSIRADLSNKESVDEALDGVVKQLGGIDILVNNAGVFRPGQLSTISLDDVQQSVQVNIVGVVQATQRALKSIKERNAEGHIIMINSGLGHRIPPPQSGSKQITNIYPGTKYALTAISEVLRQELVDQGGKIRITSISPGVTDTDLVPQQIRSSVKGLLQPEDVSSAVLYALSTPQNVQVTEISLQSSLA